MMIREQPKASESRSATRKYELRSTVRDCLFLLLIVLLSVSLYIGRLGFSSDDWGFLAVFHLSPDPSFMSLVDRANSDYGVFRPVFVVYLVALYWLFGLQPLGYHLVNAAVLLSGFLLLYLIVRELTQRRSLALAVALVYALLPHYSTDRLWMTAAPITLSMPLYLLSLYADLKAIQTRPLIRWVWKIVSMASVVASVLSYELFVPLFLLNPLLVAYRKRQRDRMTDNAILPTVRWRTLAVLSACSLVALIYSVGLKLAYTRRDVGHPLGEQLIWFAKLMAKAVFVSFGQYGVGLPGVMSKLALNHSDWTIVALGIAIGLLVGMYLYRTLTPDTLQRSLLLRLMVAGVVIFGSGYVIFLSNRNVIITPTGLGNRIAIAATIGVALSLVAGIGWGLTFIRSQTWQRRAFCSLVALVCASGFGINATIASFWVDAYQQQQLVIADIRQQFSTLPANSTVILDGVCPYKGPGVVFESNWDLAAALRIQYRDRSISADVVTPSLTVEDDGLAIEIYDNVSKYPYSDNLFVYHFGQGKIHRLTNTQMAQHYFETVNPNYDSSCPAGEPGFGSRIF
ncbi:hypothetical protein H6F43_14270 [Leptolyngbya sp. FACHB-36]|uniref:hypothetical protein n=1 Tax=Leptolyngbya sp. FACHB-36 TaxID=2692808 RepID=UPI001680AF0C|nr:hypothetical protein [Leptolyngbya sp. FACHB-36]MBD2021342.1 hypothetical protein [Leptolyngbya sp. FACHB-36]